MNEHVNFNETRSAVELDGELAPVFVQDPDDYPVDCTVLCVPHVDEDEDEDDEDHDAEVFQEEYLG